MKNIKEMKQNLRIRSKAYREGLDAAHKLRLDEAIKTRLFGLREYKTAKTVLLYVSKPIEVDTIEIMQSAWKCGKRVAVPRCVPGVYEMEFYSIRSLSDLEKGAFGVLEPIPEKCCRLEEDAEGLCIVPGLGFDKQGYRLGYGKGYYDRFLSRFHGVTVGICYAQCVQGLLPHGYYDKPVEILITERYIRNIQNVSGKGVQTAVRNGRRQNG